MQSLSIYQIIVPILSLYILFRILKHYRRGVYTIGIMILGTILWGGIAIVAGFPQVTDQLTRFTGLKSNVNALVFASILILILLVFHLSLKLNI